MNITTDELRKRIDAGDQVTIVDVREPWEYAEGHIKGAKLNPLNDIRKWAAQYAKEQELVLICRTGARSSYAYKNLQALGFSNLRNVTGGMVAWRGEVER
jgi:rhodanese-related sulfurtransferase